MGLYPQELNFTCHPLSLVLPVLMLSVCVSVCEQMPAACPLLPLSRFTDIGMHVFTDTHRCSLLLHVYRFPNVVGGLCVFHHSSPVDSTRTWI